MERLESDSSEGRRRSVRSVSSYIDRLGKMLHFDPNAKESF